MEKTISRIEVQKKDKSRVNIFIDEEFAFACSADLVYYYSLEKGKKIDLGLLQDIVEEDNYLKGKNYALKIIERSYKSEKEIEDKLFNKGYGEKAVTRIIAFLKKYNFINDEKYAETFIKGKLSCNGKNKIKYLLLKKGISEDIIQNKLNSIKEDDEKACAFKLAEKKYVSLIKSESNLEKIYKKLGHYLVSRGYDFDVVKSTLDKVIKREDLFLHNLEQEDCSKEEDDLEVLKTLAEKRYNILIKSERDSEKLYRKLSQYLIRRGYKWEYIKKVLKEIWSNE
ncbi:recombination regulator RecX [Clostridium colicanis]|uniref:Regulatory protein RecX n=1 Tax=Clostridium colicanis DSM 13634 TaxID=1121305 RepID=A0A151ARG5_9CLOT|nr:recombination regulator RecX [Clostridium colicanis]KYH30241.1 regulatory protein RecX [Clostridium colicanis DSM 13634]